MINFGSNFKKMLEDVGIEVPEYKVIKVGNNSVKLKIQGSNSEIDAILESLENPPSKQELDLLEKDGIEINFENEVGCSPYSKDIVTTENGMFYKGRRVVLHIAEAYYRKNKSTPPEKLHKYHLHYCKALQEQKAKGNLEKYRVSLSKDSTFHYVFKERNGGVVENQKLDVCGYCSRDLQSKKPKDFDLAKFLDEQPKTVESGDSPKFLFDGLSLDGFDFDYNSVSAEYQKDWRDISIARKKAENYTCQECGWKPIEKRDKRFIHTHHLDKNKSNNLSSNLKVLCIKCHFNYHPTLKEKEDYKKFEKIKNSKKVRNSKIDHIKRNEQK